MVPQHARLFVMEDPTKPPPTVALIATLVGGMVVSPNVFSAPNPQAACYGRAFNKQRVLWISPQCKAESPETIAMMQGLIAQEKQARRYCRWSIWEGELDAFVQRYRARAKKHSSERFAVVARGQAPMLQGIAPRQCLTLKTLLEKHREVQVVRLAIPA